MRKIICFHNPDEINGYLSNWFLSDFEKNGVSYSSMEQYMMHQKALVMGDGEYAGRIMNTTDTAVIKQLGKAVRNYNDTVWNGVRQIIIYEGLLEKFRQNEELRERVVAAFKELGFSYVTLDLQGYRTGSMNELLGRDA